MPKVSLTTSADRSEGVLDNMHPRLTEEGAEVILLPDDLLEGKGNFLEVDSDGNPEGFSLGQLPQLTGRNAYMGTTAGKTLTKQNAAPIALHQTSFPVNGPLADGDEAPEPFVLSSLPKPPTPTLTKIKVSVAGYPESSLDKPFWIAYSYMRGRTHTQVSRKTLVPPLAQGQSIRVKLPDTIPPGVTDIGIWLSTPGQSTASTAGQMRLQKTYPLSAYAGHEVELVGPYVYSTTAPGNTALPAPGAPKVSFRSERKAVRVGTYQFAMTVTNELGESLPGPVMGPYTIPAHSFFGEDNPAGYGQFTVSRRALPQGSAGWYLYVLLDSQWYRVYNPATSEGLRKPLSNSRESLTLGGWSGSEFYGKGDTWLLGSGEIPVENTSGVEAPETPLDTPTVFGASRPGAGTYYVRVSEFTETEESPLSDLASVEIGQDEIPVVVFGSRTNQLPNATFVEEGADGLPLFYQLSGDASLEDGELVIKSGEVSTDPILVDRTKDWSAGAFLKILDPQTGAFGGTFAVYLRENGISETLLKSIDARGEYRYRTDIAPSGYPSVSFGDDTRYVEIVYRITGNMTVRVSRQLLADYLYSFRRRGGASQTASPTGAVVAEPPPVLEASPEILGQVSPDRPVSSREVLDAGDFESAMPTGWTAHSQNAVLAREAGASLAGSTGLASRKTAGGSSGFSYIQKAYDPPAGRAERNALGAATRRKIPTLPANGAITLQELKSGEERFAWIDYDSRYEVAELEITKSPLASGSITTTLDENGTPTPRTTSIIATKESATLRITDVPDADGHVSVTLGDVARDIPVFFGQSSVKAVIQLEITRGAARRGAIAFQFGEPEPNERNLTTTFIYAPVNAGDTPEVVAQKLRGYASQPSFRDDYWIISGTGRFVTLTAKFGAPVDVSDFYFTSHVGGNETYVAASPTLLTQGRIEITRDTSETIAQRIQHTDFAGYNVSSTSDTSAVAFEALEPGIKTDASYSANDTGVSGVMTTTTQGARDTIEDIAGKVVATYSGNTYWSATQESGSDSIKIIFQSLTSGAKQDATFSPGSTGVAGEMVTTIQGSSDVVAYAKDSFGTLRQKRILTNITNADVFDIELAVSGASTPASGNSRAVVEVWASRADETLTALFEDIDYESYEGSDVAVGVTHESSSSLAWEVYTDVLSVTDGPRYRYHDYSGELLNQLHCFIPPGYLPTDDLLLQPEKPTDCRVLVLPETEYTVGAFLRWSGVKNPAHPVYLYCVTPDDDIVPIGSLTEEVVTLDDVVQLGLPAEYVIGEQTYERVVGTSDWQEFTMTFTTPANCHELRIESRQIGEGEIVIQELALSLGSEVKRTPLYATTGSYSATLNLSTPNSLGLFWERQRKILDAGASSATVPAGTLLAIEYRAADEGGAFDDPVSDVSLVAEKNVIRVDYSASGNGVFTPVIPPDSPHAEYVLLTGGKPLSTFLRGDRTELDGGVIFPERDEFIEPADIVFTPLPGGRISTTAIFGPTGNLPEAEIEVFDPETVKYITHRAGLMPFVVETAEQILTVNLGGPVRFKRANVNSYNNGRRQAIYRAKLPASWVTEIQDLP